LFYLVRSLECGKVSHDSHIVTKHDIGHILVTSQSHSHSHNIGGKHIIGII